MRIISSLIVILILVLTSVVHTAVHGSPAGKNKSDLQMIPVHGGSFLMGAGDEQGSDKPKEELPVHKVTLNDFSIGKFEITQDLWEKIMGSNPSKFRNPKAPVEQITWYDAVEFCNKLSLYEGLTPCYKIDKSAKDPANTNYYDKLKWTVTCDFSANGYRLPTEAEWEYAARGGNKTQNFKYSGSNESRDAGWYWTAENKKEAYEPGLKQPNELGIYDMSGNVGEFVWDWYGEYPSTPQVNPTGPPSGTHRIGRGGSWYLYGNFTRVSARIKYQPDYQIYHLGLRVVKRGGIGTPKIDQEAPEIIDGGFYHLIKVNGGSFLMGAGDEQGSDKPKEELPVHKVTLNDFSIGKFEVTQDLWEKIMGNNPSKFRNPKAPVEQITWYDAVEFCNKLSLHEGLTPCYKIDKSAKDPANTNNYDKLKWTVTCDFSANGYRLPTEAEWEYAARGGNKTQNFKYSGSNESRDAGWYWTAENKKEAYEPGLKQPNELGIYDMSGNVGEFVWDWYGEYPSTPQVNPTGPPSGTHRIGRGGSWYLYGNFTRVSARIKYQPDYQIYHLGLRLVRK